MKRAVIIVLDSVGAGLAADAAEFGDEGASTLVNIKRARPDMELPNLNRLGLCRVSGLDILGRERNPCGAYCRVREASRGKDTTTGHWEIAGVVTKQPFPTYPDGFPPEVIGEFERRTGRKAIGNRAASGTRILEELGEEHVRTGALIVYTSADSVFQIAMHESVIPIEEQYAISQTARDMLTGEHAVARVITRPFTGEAGRFKRTSNRRDFSLAPSGETILDVLKAAGKTVAAVGKIEDIFCGRGVTEAAHIVNNMDGVDKTVDYLNAVDGGLIFTNLVDFDMLYGHRNDADGYKAALEAFDARLPEILAALREDDLLFITADHGCDPTYPGTDHTREDVPLLVYSKRGGFRARDLRARQSFADIGATVLDYLGTAGGTAGESFLAALFPADDKRLIREAMAARELSYSPYSGFMVGAALLAESGKVYTGCNIENAAFSPTNCAERTAAFKAVSEGERGFEAIAVVGGKRGADGLGYTFPCGVCRQVLAEFCEAGAFRVIVAANEGDYTACTLAELLPHGFGAGDLGADGRNRGC